MDPVGITASGVAIPSRFGGASRCSEDAARVAGEDRGAERRPGVDGRLDAGAARVGSFLVVEVCRDEGLTFLDVRSRVDPFRACLLSLGHQPTLAGLCVEIRLSRIAGLYLALAYGVGPLPERPLVRFDTATLRYRRTVDAVPQPVSADVWFAEAEGTFATASLLRDDQTIARTGLTDYW
jgi:hypothetical protein